MAKPVDLLQGTLDMLILKAVSLGRLHGYGILLRIQQISGDQLVIQQGSLYPALYRRRVRDNDQYSPDYIFSVELHV
jgi:PadR family transcriptional regulator, regulatory protein PadR